MIQNEWLTRDCDLQDAEMIIRKHIDLNDGEPLGLFEMNLDDRNDMDLKIADWIIELSDFFNHKYGNRQGTHVTKMVVSKCLRNGEPLH